MPGAAHALTNCLRSLRRLTVPDAENIAVTRRPDGDAPHWYAVRKTVTALVTLPIRLYPAGAVAAVPLTGLS
jgi:hypothetical protein